MGLVLFTWLSKAHTRILTDGGNMLSIFISIRDNVRAVESSAGPRFGGNFIKIGSAIETGQNVGKHYNGHHRLNWFADLYAPRQNRLTSGSDRMHFRIVSVVACGTCGVVLATWRSGAWIVRIPNGTNELVHSPPPPKEVMEIPPW